MTRQANAIVDAYMNQYDFRGMGVPTRDYVISYLREYLGNSWITQADRDQITQNIQRINEEENERIETGFINAINADPTDTESVKDYIAFLREQADGAESPNLQSEARSKLFNALGTLVDRVGEKYKGGLIDGETFAAQTQEALNEYEKGSSQHRQILTKVVTSKYDAEFKQQNQLLSNAAADGSDAYLAKLRVFRKWAANQVTAMAAEGLAQVNENGDVVSGIDAALDAQTRLNDVSQKIKDAGAIAAKEAATKRLNTMNKNANEFLKQVNQVLGSNYGTLQSFAANQIDVNRFYSAAPASVRGTDGFMGRDKFVNFMFGSGNSLMQAAKAAGVAQYKELNKLSKGYGRNTLVDDAAIVVNIEAAIVHVECTPPVTVNAIVNVEPRTMRQSMAVSSATQFNRWPTLLIVAVKLCRWDDADDCLVGDNARGRPELTQLTRREEGGGGAMARKAV
jgi:hypothetical protein